MPMYGVCWENGDVSFISAPNRRAAVAQLDEWASTDPESLQVVNNFAVDFTIDESGNLVFNGFSEYCEHQIAALLKPRGPNGGRRCGISVPLAREVDVSN